MKLSIQLYSLRDAIASNGIEAVLTAVKSAGFDAVETAGTYDMSASELAATIARHGLAVSGAHISADELLQNPDGVKAFCDATGLRDAILPWFTNEAFLGKGDFDRIAAMRDNCNARGIGLQYHNHHFEFKDGDGLKKLADAVDGIAFELDTFWLRAAGHDPAAYAEQFTGKIAQFHIKELSADGIDAPNPIPGQGVTGIEPIMHLAKKLGHDYAVLEVEVFDMGYQEYLKRSVQALRAMMA